MQKIFDGALWFLFLLFIVPTILIMVSWSSYPGDAMYSVKLALERTLLFVAKPNYAAEASLNVAYTERRFTEAKVMLANDKTGKGLSYLSDQVTSTTKVIDRAPNQATKKKIATEYVAKLKEVRSTLNQEPGTIRTNVAPTRVPNKVAPVVNTTNVIQVTNVTNVTNVVVHVLPTSTPSPVAPTQATGITTTTTQTQSVELTQTNQILDQNIANLEAIINSSDENDNNSNNSMFNNNNFNNNDNNRGRKGDRGGGNNDNDR